MTRFFVLFLTTVFLSVAGWAQEELQYPDAQPLPELRDMTVQIDTAIRGSAILKKYGLEVVEEKPIAASLGLVGVAMLPVHVLNNIFGEDHQWVEFRVRNRERVGEMTCRIVHFRDSRSVSVVSCDAAEDLNLLSIPGIRFDSKHRLLFAGSSTLTNGIARFSY